MLRRRPLTFALVLALAASCGDGVAARVDGVAITDVALERELGSLESNPAYLAHLAKDAGEHPLGGDGRFSQAFVAQILTRQIYYEATRAEAREEGVSASSVPLGDARVEAAGEVGGPRLLEAFPDRYRDQLIERQRLLIALHRAAVKGEDPRELYDSNRERFLRICSRHIAVATGAEAQDVKQRLDAGEDFARLAEEVSDDASTSGKGGDLGCNDPGDLSDELNLASLEQDVGEVGEPIETNAGWHLLLVYKRFTPAFRDITGEVNAVLAARARTRVGTALRQRLADGVDVAGRYGTWDEDERRVVPR